MYFQYEYQNTLMWGKQIAGEHWIESYLVFNELLLNYKLISVGFV